MIETDEFIPESDYRLAARHTDAQCLVESLRYRIACIHAEASQKCEPLQQELDRAMAVYRTIQKQYNRLCARIGIDPRTDQDIEELDDEEENDW